MPCRRCWICQFRFMAKGRMNFQIIFTKANMIISKKSYDSWEAIQDEYKDYMAS